MDDLLFMAILVFTVGVILFCMWGAYAIIQIAENAFTTI